MSYTALYRKWRSATFDEVVGQDAIVQTLKNQIKTERIGHAYLFCGTRGTGKTSIAKIFARAVNCEHPIDGNPCNECASCRSILHASSMNVMEMDAASNNGVENIRDIRDQVEYPPTEGRYRVFIIDEVHMLSIGAFNALLKTLEEPPEYVIFILATTEVHKIPITILSRCQRYDFRRIPAEVIAGRLKTICDGEDIAVSEDALSYIARAGDGSMRDAVSLLDQCVAFHYGKRLEYEDALDILGAVDTGVFSDLLRALARRDVAACLDLISVVVEQGRELAQFVGDFIWYVRNLLMARAVEDPSRLVDMSRDNLARLREDARLLSQEELMRYIRMLSELSNQLRYAVQKRVLLETVLMRMAYPETDVTTEGLQARMAELERRMAEGAFALPANGAQAGAEAARANADAAEQAALAEPKQVVLPKAQYEDLMLLKAEWKNIVAELDGSNKAALMESYLMPNKGTNSMNIIFENRTKYMVGSREEVLLQLHEIVARRYQKDIEFRAVLTTDAQTRHTLYVTEEEVSQKINYEIDFDDDGGEALF